MALGAQAGDWGKAPVGGKEPYCPEAGPVEVNVGYLSHYILRGYAQGVDVLMADVNYDISGFMIPLNVGISVHNMGNYYSNLTGNYGGSSYKVYGSSDIGNFAGFDVNVGAAYYFALEDGNDEGFGELSLQARRDLGFAEMIFTSVYGLGQGEFDNGDYDPKGFYNELAFQKVIGLTEKTSLVATAGVSYISDTSWEGEDRFHGSGWNHYFVTLDFPVQVKCNITFTPYVGWNGSPRGWSTYDTYNSGGVSSGLNQGNILHGGAKFSVNF